ncbi:hypothetical protein PYCC9005_005505 [Savitreella phatthalungensis]
MVVLQWEVLGCCGRVSAGACAANSLGVVQMGLQWVMFAVTLVLFLVYFPRPATFARVSFNTDVPTPGRIPRHATRAWQVSVAVTAACIVHLVVFAAVSLSFLRERATRGDAVTWANWVGFAGAVLAAAQYVPQVVWTLRRRRTGSLSVATLAVQAPGSFILAYSIARRPGVAPSSYTLFLVGGILQTLLLVICIGLDADNKVQQSVLQAHATQDDHLLPQPDVPDDIPTIPITDTHCQDHADPRAHPSESLVGGFAAVVRGLGARLSGGGRDGDGMAVSKARERYGAWVRERRKSMDEDERTRLLTQRTSGRSPSPSPSTSSQPQHHQHHHHERDLEDVVTRHGPRVDEPQLTTDPGRIELIENDR